MAARRREKGGEMGMWGTLKKHASSQFLEVIEWLDDSNDTIVYRYPVFNQKITDNSKLVVRESQGAVFVSEGKFSDVFGPGTYTLDTRNAPILSFFQSIAYKLNYPYKGDIYFVNTKVFRENKWGTPTAIPMHDPEFGPIEIRGFGSFNFRISDPALFMRRVVGTDGLFTTDEINGQLRQELVQALPGILARSGETITKIAANYVGFSAQVCEALRPSMESEYGVHLEKFVIGSITLPPELQESMRLRSRMNMIGDMNQYTQMKAADAIETAAANPGMAGAGMGMGMGVGMGNMMGNMMGNAMAGAAAASPPPPPQAQTFHYSGPSGQAQLSASDIAQKIAADRNGNHQVWAEGWSGWRSWNDVGEISRLVPPPPAAAPPPPPGAASTFHYHGPSGSSEKSLSDVVAAVKAAPDADHHVWKEGFDGWKPATEVAEIAAALSSGPPPPPGSGSGGPPPPPM